MESRRTSGRRRQPSKKYSIDPFEGLDIPDELTDGPASSVPEVEAEEEDADFQAEANASPETLEEDVFEDEAIRPGDFEGVDENADEELEYDESVNDGSDVDAPANPSGRGRGHGNGGGDGIRPNRKLQPRGLLEPHTRGNKANHRLFHFGPSAEDQNPGLQAHFKWRDEPSIPSSKPSLSGRGGFKRSYYQTDDAFQRDANEGWDWYEVEGGKEAFRDQQSCSSLLPEQGQAYMPSTHNTHNFVMGPYKKQKLFHLPVGGSIDLNDAWKSEPEPTSADAEGVPLDSRIARHGWILNLGEEVQCLDWVPNQEGPRQFLAVSTLRLLNPFTRKSNFQARSAPAFTPQPPHKSATQIWEFMVDKEGGLDTQRPPQLRQVICMPWGDIRSFKWCPMPRSQASFAKLDGQVNLGLLGSLWGDGVVRVLDISIPDVNNADVQYTLISKAAFSTRPPNTVCTCFTWLSSNSIVAGCANGCVGVWNLPTALYQDPPQSIPIDPTSDFASYTPTKNAEPLVYFPISSTYILTIISCYPSHANLILTSTMAGYIHLTDLHDLRGSSSFSAPATVKSSRSRLGRPVLVWHDYSQMVFTADDNFALVAMPLRRIWRQYSFTRYKSSVQAIAVSPVHPFIMSGCVGGDVTCNNPLRRAFDNKAPIWNQVWFTHDWRPCRDDEATDDTDTTMGNNTTTSSALTQRTSRRGLSRILESHKAEQMKVSNPHDSFMNRKDGAVYSTVYEIETAVRAVCWNPNIQVGGWAAAGMASGLLRVEDISA